MIGVEVRDDDVEEDGVEGGDGDGDGEEDVAASPPSASPPASTGSRRVLSASTRSSRVCATLWASGDVGEGGCEEAEAVDVADLALLPPPTRLAGLPLRFSDAVDALEALDALDALDAFDRVEAFDPPRGLPGAIGDGRAMRGDGAEAAVSPLGRAPFSLSCSWSRCCVRALPARNHLIHDVGQ